MLSNSIMMNMNALGHAVSLHITSANLALKMLGADGEIWIKSGELTKMPISLHTLPAALKKSPDTTFNLRCPLSRFALCQSAQFFESVMHR